MRRTTWLSRWILISGAVLSLIAVAHNAFAPAMYQAAKNDPAVKDKAAGLVYFFVLGGSAYLFAGLLTMYASTGLRKAQTWAWTVAISSGVFVALASIAAIVYARFHNPMIYVAGLCAVSNVLLLLVLSPSRLACPRPTD